MGLIVTTIDEAGVNELFVKAFNRIPDQAFERQINRDLGPVDVELKFKGRVRARDLPGNARPIDLRGSAQNPPIRYQNVPIELRTDLEFRVWVAGQERLVTAPFTAVVMLAGNAHAAVGQSSTHWRPRVECDMADVSVSFADNRQAFVSVVQQMPGLQGPVRALAVAAAGDLFDEAAGQAGDTATQLLRALSGSLRASLGVEIPRRSTLQVPGGEPVEVEIVQLHIAITANSATLKAQFI